LQFSQHGEEIGFIMHSLEMSENDVFTHIIWGHF